MSDDQSAEALDLPASIRDGKVIEGRDGRLFLANDANRVLDQHSGRAALRPTTSCASGATLLETRTAWLERRGSRHYFLIAPDAHSVYPDVAAARACPSAAGAPGPPAARAPARARVIRARRLSAGGAARDRRRARCTPKTGSHWTQPRAPSIACRALVEEIRRDVASRAASRSTAFELRRSWTSPGTWARRSTPSPGPTYIRADRARRARTAGQRQPRAQHRAAHRLRVDDASTEPVMPGLRRLVRRCACSRSWRRASGGSPSCTWSNLDFDLVRTLRPDVVVKVT